MANFVNSPMGLAIPAAVKATGKYLALNKVADTAGDFNETLGTAATLADLGNDLYEYATLRSMPRKDILGRLNVAKLPSRYIAPILVADIASNAMNWVGNRDTELTEKEMQSFKNMTREELLNYKNPTRDATLKFFNENLVGRGFANLGYWLRDNNLDSYF